MPFAGNRAAPDVEKAVSDYVRGINSSRYIPDTPDIYRQVSEANKVYIYNVGPWPHLRELGSAGTFHIAACEPGSDHSKPVVLNGVVEEPYPINEAECKILNSNGTDLAAQILGEGPFVPKVSSFRPYGVFISKSNPPLKEELATARRELQAKYLELVRYASEAYAQGPVKAAEIIQPEWHFVAARALKKSEAECPWLMNTQQPAARDECAGCGSTYKVGVMKCQQCGFILDKQKYDKAVKDGLFS